MSTADENVESAIFWIITQYAIIYQLIKLVLISKGLSNYYEAIIYLTTVMMHLILFSSYSDFIDKFKKFNFRFVALYTILTLLNSEKYLFFPCIIHSILVTYPTSRELECIAIISSNTIYSFVLAQGLIPLVIILVPKQDELTFLIGFSIVRVFTIVLGLIALFSQLREVKIRTIDDHNEFEDDNIEEGRGIQSQDKNTRINNYRTFNNQSNTNF